MELNLWVCGKGNLHTVSCPMLSVEEKGFPIFKSPVKKHNMQRS
jgi:hypothetical protein